jgi:4-oxalocrotonate tautomerase
VPLVDVKVIEGVFTPEQKAEMIRKVTDAMVSIEGENLRGVTWVAVEEARSGSWGIGGRTSWDSLPDNGSAGLAAGVGHQHCLLAMVRSRRGIDLSPRATVGAVEG